MRNPVLCQKTYCGGGEIMKWAYCTVCKKGCFTNEYSNSVTHLDCSNWIVTHKRSNCTKRFADVEYLFSGYDEIETEGNTEVNTELLEAQKTIEQLRTEIAALRSSMDSLKMTKESEPKASLPLLEVQEEDDGTITDSMALKAASKSIGILRNKNEELEKRLRVSYENHHRTIARIIEIANKLDNKDPVRLAQRSFLIPLVVGDEEDEKNESPEIVEP